MTMETLPVLLLTASLLLTGALVCAGTEQTLAFSLLDRYASVNGRPVENASEPVAVKFGLTLLQIQKMDQEAQTLTITVFLKMFWNDNFLKWNPEEYDGLKRVAFGSDKIWIPDVELFNANSRPEDLMYRDNRVVVSSDGAAINVPFLKLTSHCPCDPDAERVTCNLKFGSWVYPMGLVAIEPLETTVDTSAYEQNRDWELLRSNAQLNKVEYDCCPGEKYGDITYSLTLKSRNKKVKQEVTSAASTTRHLTAAILAAILMCALL